MTKHSTFSYLKPGPGFLDHLASTRGPGAEGRGHGTSYSRPIIGVAATQLGLVSFAKATALPSTLSSKMQKIHLVWYLANLQEAHKMGLASPTERESIIPLNVPVSPLN